jgi:vacuolar protein sorting-associated protein 3
MDTVLAKIFAESEKTTDLYALIHNSEDISLDEVEPVLKTTGQYNALCMLYRQRGDDLKLLEAWSK